MKPDSTDNPDQPTINSPVAVGQRIVCTVTDVAFGGEGVARLADFVIFLPFVLAGEEVLAEVTEVKKRFARARVIQVVKAAAERVKPRCQYFGECGGCQYQHMAYEAQLVAKHKQVVDLFTRMGGFPSALVAPVIPSPQPYGYRNRIMIRSQWDKFKQALNIGFIRFDNRLVVDLDSCAIAEPEVSAQIRRVRANPPPKGGLKVVLRLMPEGWEVPPDSFFQNNFHLLPRLIETVRTALTASRSRHLVDLYCGVGFFAIELADLVDSYAGVEVDQMAVRAARRNATQRGRLNGEFVVARAEEALPELLGKFTASATSVLIDPPRTGCDKGLLEHLRAVRPAQILYVSCHPATLARDLNALCRDAVYELVHVTPLDMFPQTQHVECVADLRLTPAGAASRNAEFLTTASTEDKPTLPSRG